MFWRKKKTLSGVEVTLDYVGKVAMVKLRSNASQDDVDFVKRWMETARNDMMRGRELDIGHQY